MRQATVHYRLTIHRPALAAVAAILASCGVEPAGPLSPIAPTIVSSSITANPRNVLSAAVSVRVRDADSVVVRFHVAGAAGADSVTAAVLAAEDAAVVPVLGLLPSTRYALRAVAFGPGGETIGDALELTTAALPEDVPRYTAGGPSPSPGYIVFAAGSYGVVIDNTGRVVWYHHFPNGIGLSFTANSMGRYVARHVTPDPTDIEPWVEIDPLGNTRRTLGCARGLQPRFHDLIVEPDGGYWIMCDESRTMDLTPFAGVGRARVVGTAVQHILASGALRFHWSPFDHFAITDVDQRERTDSVVNWTHGNALDIDVDGNLLVSFRNLNEITKIDIATGSVIWRLGGLRNQFAISGAPAPAFAQQHSVRIDGRGSIMILDNVGNPNESSAERYLVDGYYRTAHLVRSYVASPRVVTQIGGSTQPLPGGGALVSFGTAGRVEEYDEAGRVVWRILGNAGYVFRAQRIRSLYAPGASR